MAQSQGTRRRTGGVVNDEPTILRRSLPLSNAAYAEIATERR